MQPHHDQFQFKSNNQYCKSGITEALCSCGHSSPRTYFHAFPATPSHPATTMTPSPPPHTHTLSSHTHTHTPTCAQPPDTCPLITHRLLPSLCSRGLMGNLLKVLACAELEHGPIVFLDFERETIRFLFFWVIPFSMLLLPFLFLPSHSINLSRPLCHHYMLFYAFPFSSSPSSLCCDSCSRDWHLKVF